MADTIGTTASSSSMEENNANTTSNIRSAVLGLFFSGEVSLFTRILFAILVLLVIHIICEQLKFLFQHRKKQDGGKLPGPSWVCPIFGGLITMVLNPYDFWERQRLYSPTGLSWNSIMGFFAVFVADTDMARKVLNNNGPDKFTLVLHPNAYIILGFDNIAFQSGPKHKALRKSFLPLFTKASLKCYLETQQKLINKHIDKWLQSGGHFDLFRIEIRDLNLETSQTVFVGPYLKEPESFGHDYLLMTEGFLSFPIPFPGSGLWKAWGARKRVVKVLTQCVIESKEYIRNNGEARCLLDFWVVRILQDEKEAKANNEEIPHYVDNNVMAEAIMDFLFASGDASTASLTWTTAMMADRPDILAKVREEQLKFRTADQCMTYENLGDMTYTKAVVKELLRYRPPAPMVPNLAHADIQLSDDFIVPKGSVVIPSMWTPSHQGFTNPFEFDPDRMMPERQEDRIHGKNFMVFGCGPHRCVGYEYAINHISCFLAVMSLRCDWTRTRTKDSDLVEYLPTIYPRDCIVDLKPREPVNGGI